MVKTQLCKLRGTSDTFLYKNVSDVPRSLQKNVSDAPRSLQKNVSDVPRSLQSWVSTIQTVWLTADVFQLIADYTWYPGTIFVN